MSAIDISRIFLIVFVGAVNGYNSAFDYDLYERVVDTEMCDRQLSFLSNDSLGFQFVDVGAKLPSGILVGNMADFGNYYECLNIREVREDMVFEGKYSIINVPLEQNPITDLPTPNITSIENVLQSLQKAVAEITGARIPENGVVFSVIGLLTVISTTYDLHQVFISKREANTLYCSFSVYTNTRRFLSFSPNPGSLDCVDGIRTISMMWVVIGHVYSLSNISSIKNPLDIFEWLTSWSSVWILSAPIAVDTFFFLSGMLCVYSTVGKISRSTFIRNIHVFYLNRLLRMFPLLATVVLIQASWANHMSDGPQWSTIGYQVERCRKYWWSALLHVQNYVNPTEICLGQTWYLSVDIQLYIASPLVLFWLFGRRSVAWTALVIAILVSLASASAYVFVYNFPGSLVALSRLRELLTYVKKYYFNTLTRAPPFAVGLLFGYLLHTIRGRVVKIPTVNVIILWILSFLMMALAIFPVHNMTQIDHSNQVFDNFFNAYVRAIWACGLGWLIFACVHGYGGPINWFLSLNMWKLPARLSYAVYLLHYVVIATANASWVDTHYFSTAETIYRFLSDLAFTTAGSLILCIIIDAPCSTIQKFILSGGRRKQKADDVTNIIKDKESNEANIQQS